VTTPVQLLSIRTGAAASQPVFVQGDDGLTTTLQVVSGDTLYYAASRPLGNNPANWTADGSVASGSSESLSLSQWVWAGASSSSSGGWCQIAVTSAPLVVASTGVRPANTFVPIGDSVVANCANTTASGGGSAPDVLYVDNRSWIDWCQQALNQSLTQLSNAGVAGQTTAQILARFQNDVVALKPSYVFIHCGVNDIQAAGVGSEAAAATTAMANIAAMCVQAKAAGIRVVLFTTLTSGSGAGQLGTGTRLQAMIQLQQAIAAYARDNSNIILCDWAGLYSTAATGYSLSLLTGDGTHPATQGASRLGQYLATVLTPYVNRVDLLPNSAAETTNKAKAPMATGTGGTLSVGTGSLATSMILEIDSGVGQTVAASKVARTDNLPGEWQQLAFSAGKSKVRLVDDTLANLGFAVGDRIQFGVEFQTDSSGWTGNPGIWLDLQALTSGFGTINALTSIARSIWLFNMTSGTPVPDTTQGYDRMGSGVMRTTVLTIPAGAGRIMGTFRIDSTTGAGTIRIGRSYCRKLS
jgi:lysophospholipase L1-like esterase